MHSEVKPFLMDDPPYREQARRRPIATLCFIHLKTHAVRNHRDFETGIEVLRQLTETIAIGNDRRGVLPNDSQERSDQLMIEMKIIRTESRHIATPQRDDIRDLIYLFEQPGNGTGRNAKKSQGGIRFEMRYQAQGP